MKTLYTITKIEFKLAFREFSGILFGVLIPVGLIILFGIIYGNNLAYEGATYTIIQQELPAVITIGIISTGLMGIPIVISDYRAKKILKRFKVTPTSPLKLLLAQGLNALIISLTSSTLVWVVSRVFFGYRVQGSIILFICYYFLTVITIYSLGFLVASVAKTVKTSNLLTSLLYFPMMLLSGATIPYGVLPKGLQTFSYIMPLTHSIKLLKSSSLGVPLEGGIISIIYLCVLTAICTIVSVKTFRWE